MASMIARCHRWFRFLTAAVPDVRALESRRVRDTARVRLIRLPCAAAWVTAICVTQVLMSACSSVPAGEPDPLTATTAVTGSTVPAPLATHMALGTQSEGWTLTGMDSDGRRLFITYALGDPCSESAGVLVEESAKTVTLTATTRKVRGGNCQSVLRSAEGYVDLQQPLGTRTLLHASMQRTPDGS